MKQGKKKEGNMNENEDKGKIKIKIGKNAKGSKRAKKRA
jgi:hypothetical protein